MRGFVVICRYWHQSSIKTWISIGTSSTYKNVSGISFFVFNVCTSPNCRLFVVVDMWCAIFLWQPQLLPLMDEIPQSSFQFDFDLERKILEEAKKEGHSLTGSSRRPSSLSRASEAAATVMKWQFPLLLFGHKRNCSSLLFTWLPEGWLSFKCLYTSIRKYS